MEKCYKAAYSTTLTKWDCTTLVAAESLLLTIDKVTDATWLSSLTVESTIEDVTTYSAALIEDKPSKVPLNPTKWITNQFINDGLTSAILTDFRMPALSADVNDTFKKTFIANLLRDLQTSTYSSFNLLNLPNKNILSSIDYLTMNPTDDTILQTDKNVSVLAQFVYKCLVEYSCQWSLVFPLIKNMTKGYMRSEFTNLFKSVAPIEYMYTITVPASNSTGNSLTTYFPSIEPPLANEGITSYTV
jgi:hypothetical protein